MSDVDKDLTFVRLARSAARQWPDAPSEESARRLIRGLSREQLERLVFLQLVDEIEEHRWRIARPTLLSGDPDERGVRRSVLQRTEARRATPEERQEVLRKEGAQGYASRFGVGTLVDVFKRDVALSLTPEVLSAPFTLPGRRLTFGSASVAEHEERMHRLLETAKGLIETYRMHEAAVALLTARHASCLNDLAEVAA